MGNDLVKKCARKHKDATRDLSGSLSPFLSGAPSLSSSLAPLFLPPPSHPHYLACPVQRKAPLLWWLGLNAGAAKRVHGGLRSEACRRGAWCGGE